MSRSRRLWGGAEKLRAGEVPGQGEGLVDVLGAVSQRANACPAAVMSSDFAVRVVQTDVGNPEYEAEQEPVEAVRDDDTPFTEELNPEFRPSGRRGFKRGFE